GHANPRVQNAVAGQMGRLVHVSNLYYTEPQIALAERLVKLSGLDKVFFANDGATANECAIKLARRWAQKRRGPDAFEVVTLDGSFHGRTLATLAATGQPSKQATFQPLPGGFRQVPAGDIDALARLIGRNTAAVMVETIQGEGGVIPMPADYLIAIRRLCDESGVLMIVDDVQAGIGRTGTWFSWQSLGFAPDIATSAKALANGLPIGACLARNEIAGAFDYGDHATTFGGGPVVSMAAMATLDEIAEVLPAVAERSDQLRRGLEQLEGVRTVRGRGLFLAAVLDHDRAGTVTVRAMQHGLVVDNVRPNAVRFTPPLIISAEEVAEAVRRFSMALRDEQLG
ncbi:MAG TPA: aminotransferase class III-fold pyridoxal phosphate-dependent enzyme, partial [Acidimicrobiia bacterium]|nr:aminotransferase class III-fold pyridoxal phosphate-dependent enzyme [Acidimicrobiia bacterium]